jgi:hypothetical protein
MLPHDVGWPETIISVEASRRRRAGGLEPAAPTLAFLSGMIVSMVLSSPTALNLHLVLSVSFFQRSRVSPKLSVVGRRLFRPVRVLATC